ncbi:MAG: hypothetical protein K2F65_06575, partial [Eubacterium sp.]|nr:hypothetical protein [Eubacterium sp.]
MKKFLNIFIVIVIAVIAFALFANLTPTSYEKCLVDLFGSKSILFESEEMIFGDDTGVIVSSIDDCYNITAINKTNGWLNNQCECDFSFSYDKNALEEALTENTAVTDYVNTFDDKDKTGCYLGIVPLDCKYLSFDGASAKFIEQSVKIDGEEYEFYLYYLPTENKENAEI